MSNKTMHIMLIDDNQDDNFIHKRTIKKNDEKSIVIVQHSAIDALEYIRSKTNPTPDFIFLDINMPLMNGWQFLKEYEKLDKDLQSQAIIIMLTSSEDPDDLAKSMQFSFPTEYITKPLTQEVLNTLNGRHFKD